MAKNLIRSVGDLYDLCEYIGKEYGWDSPVVTPRSYNRKFVTLLEFEIERDGRLVFEKWEE